MRRILLAFREIGLCKTHSPAHYIRMSCIIKGAFTTFKISNLTTCKKKKKKSKGKTGQLFHVSLAKERETVNSCLYEVFKYTSTKIALHTAIRCE